MTSASPPRTRSGPPRPLRRCGAISPVGRPASTRARSARRRPVSTRSAGPDSPLIEPEDVPREGGSGLCSKQDRRPGVLRLPGRESGRSRNPRSLGVRPRTRHRAALDAARAADRDRNPASNPSVAGRRSTANAGRRGLAGRGRRRDRAGRRLRPRPCRRSCPPLQNPDRRRAQPARQTGGQNRRPAAQPRLRLARRSGAPGADDRPRCPPAVRPARRAGAARELTGRLTFRLYGL